MITDEHLDCGVFQEVGEVLVRGEVGDVVFFLPFGNAMGGVPPTKPPPVLHTDRFSLPSHVQNVLDASNQQLVEAIKFVALACLWVGPSFDPTTHSWIAVLTFLCLIQTVLCILPPPPFPLFPVFPPQRPRAHLQPLAQCV
jgi:hypothetical protein